jgi:hypothetical protein
MAKKDVNISPYGVARDFTSFYAAIVPPRKSTALGPKLHLPLAETALMAKGKIIRWLQTAPNGEATERLEVDKKKVEKSFRDGGRLQLPQHWPGHEQRGLVVHINLPFTFLQRSPPRQTTVNWSQLSEE